MTIERMRILDGDARDWIDAIFQYGFSQKEIDRIMAHLNATYAKLRAKELADEAFRQLMQDQISQFGKVIIPPEHMEALKQSLERHYQTKRLRESPDAPLMGYVDE
jgi:hypothetical protein